MTNIPSRLITALADRHCIERQLGEGGTAATVPLLALQRRPDGDVESPRMAWRMGVGR
jgi:hypothetical protein